MNHEKNTTRDYETKKIIIPFKIDANIIKNDSNLLSVDRIDSKLPYFKNNIHLITHIVNMGKNDLDESRFIELIKTTAEYTLKMKEN